MDWKDSTYTKKDEHGLWYRCRECNKEDSLTGEQKLLTSIFGELPLCEKCECELIDKIKNRGIS